MIATDTEGRVKLAPTFEAIEKWRWSGQEARRRGVDIRTKAGTWRCISGVATYSDGSKGYWTIRAEGKSSAGRETAIHEREIVAARGWAV